MVKSRLPGLHIQPSELVLCGDHSVQVIINIVDHYRWQMSIRSAQVHHVVQVHRCSTFRSMRLAHSDSFPSGDWPIGPVLSLSRAISLVGSLVWFVLISYSNQKVGLIGKLSWFVQFGWICFSSVVGIYLRWVSDHEDPNPTKDRKSKRWWLILCGGLE